MEAVTEPVFISTAPLRSNSVVPSVANVNIPLPISPAEDDEMETAPPVTLSETPATILMSPPITPAPARIVALPPFASLALVSPAWTLISEPIPEALAPLAILIAPACSEREDPV